MTVPGVARDAGEGGLLGLAVRRGMRAIAVYAYFTSTRGDNRIVRFKLGERVRTVLTGLRSAGHPQRRADRVRAGRQALRGRRRRREHGLGPGPVIAERQDPAHGPGRRAERSRVWSLGHRNVQGLAWDRRGRLWASEFGQNARDEVNLIRRGRNYGWPEVEGVGSTSGGRFTNPKVTWATSAASPSGAAIIGTNLYVAALQGECVWKIPLDGASAGKPTRMLAGPLRADPDRGRGAGRDAVGGDVQPRRPRLPARRRRPDRRGTGMRGVPMSDEVLRSMQMTAGNQAVGRAIAEGRIAPVVSADGASARQSAGDEADGGAGAPDERADDPLAPEDGG